MKKSTVIISSIMLVVLCWVSILLVACKKEGIIATPGEDRPAEKIMQPVAFDDSALKQEIADLKEQVGDLQNENGQLKSAQKDADEQKSRLSDENKNLKDQNKALQEENSTLGERVALLNQTIATNDAAHQEEIARLNKVLAEREESYQAAQKQFEEQNQKSSSAPALADSSSGSGSGKVQDSEDNTASKAASSTRVESQVRNVLGFKIGPDMLDIEATIAILPHWFLIANAGMVETPEDFVEDKFPGHSSNHNIFSGKYNYLFDVMGGMGLNWQFNSLPAQPNLYLSTMIGPAWFMYKEDGDLTFKRYLLWRTSVGFDLTIYKDLLFTTDIGFDWMEDYDFTPRLAVGLLYRYSSRWSLFGKK